MEQRQCLMLVGDVEWCKKSIVQLLIGFDSTKVICFSGQELPLLLTLPQKQAQTKLGHEFDAVVFDASVSICPDSLGISIGTIKAGGLLILCMPILIVDDLWMKRFRKVIYDYVIATEGFYKVEQGDVFPLLSIPEQVINDLKNCERGDQLKAVQAIHKVVYGHRRRPLVLSADRGRGKSAALGIAAARLLQDGKRKILVTAPSLAIAATVFKHASLLLPEAAVSKGLICLLGAEIRFIAPDALIKSTAVVDLLLVDEAAAIPAVMLEKMLEQYSRIVFSTTLHGYEGTGQGFSVRFKKLLDQKAPGWKVHHMNKPIRWLEDDQLEAMSFDALLLNAEPVQKKLVLNATIDQCVLEKLDRQYLIENDSLLRELFGLMVLAHYRTRPSDLKMLIDHEGMSIYVVRYQGHIVGSAWVVNEGELSANVAEGVYQGERRLAGHLLPQSLISHVGLKSAGTLRYRRLVRIVVHPELQRRRLGTALITRVFEDCVEDKIDLLGASFGADIGLIEYWHQAEFRAVRLGSQRDDVGGCHSMMMMKAPSKKGAEVLAKLCSRFQVQWPILLSTQFKGLDTLLVLKISSLEGMKAELLPDWDWQDVNSFAHSLRTYESCQISLIKFTGTILCNTAMLAALSSRQQQLLVLLLIQQQPLVNVVQKLGYTGKKELLLALRAAISHLI
jgi:tRNA(Met) cytidine acetyltransferase